MEQTRKQLKISSIVVLVFAALSLIKVLGELAWGGFDAVDGIEGGIVLATKIIILVITLLLLLPQLYIGIKGLKIAKNPDSSKAHIVLAIILLVLSALGLISPIFSLFNQGVVYDCIRDIASILIEVVIFFEYIKYAEAVRKAN